MRTDTEIKIEGFEILSNAPGMVVDDKGKA